jgi:hypothetical protein
MGATKIGIGIVATVAALVIGGGAFIGTGVFNIGADGHHTQTASAIIGELKERSIGVRSGSIDLRYVDAPYEDRSRGQPARKVTQGFQ